MTREGRVRASWGSIMKSYLLAATALAFAVPAAAQTVVHNSAPASGWFYGNGNDYTPANSSVLTTDDGDQIALRFHKTFEKAPASANGVYSFALGTSPLSFDWSFTNNSGTLNISTITLTNVGTGQSFSYNPFLGSNATQGNTTQNSFRFNWIPGLFDPNVDATYNVAFDNSQFSAIFEDGAAGPQAAAAGERFLSIDAVFGAGAANGAVPEPSAWALMILGFGLAGAAMRRRGAAAIRYA